MMLSRSQQVIRPLRSFIGRRRLPASITARGYRRSREEHDSMHSNSLRNVSEFWDEAAQELDWFKPYDTTLDDSNSPFDKWFSGGELNVCYNAVDRWVERGFGDRNAIIYDSPATKQTKKITFKELQQQVAKFASVLSSKGVEKGDRVVIYMPMIPEAVVAMLASARIGAVHSVVFGGFASRELAVRIDDAKPKAVVSATCGVEPNRVVSYMPLLEGALEMAKHKPTSVIVKKRAEVDSEDNTPPKAQFDEWDEVMDTAAQVDCVPVESSDPLYILYTSGTTGQPKGVLRDSGGYAAALRWSMEHFMDVKPGETYFAASDIGWVVGHSYIVYGPLLNGNTTVLFEGKPIIPNAGVFWRVIEDHAVNAMFTAPTALRAIRRIDPSLELAHKYDISSLRALFLAGERADPNTVTFFADKLQKPIVDNFWQTELGWPSLGFQLTDVGIRAGSAARPVPGFDVHVLCEETSKELGPHELGDVAIKLPLAPGSFKTLYNADDRFVETYFKRHPGYYNSGDAGMKDEDGYFHVMARTDDVINTAGHRLSSGAIEEVLSSHPDVAECAVIGAYDGEKGQVPIGFLLLKAGSKSTPEEVEKQVIANVRRDIGPVAAFKNAFVVDQLPKTRSGKILRGIMLKIADGKEYTVPGTVEDITAVDHIKDVLKNRWTK